MKILHTSDWHIGKKLMGRERNDEYRAALKEICSICESEEIELCLVAGDVFDTYTPSAEAEEIFYDGIKEIAKFCAVLIISGNHDDYIRLTAAAAIAQELNIYITGNNLQKIRCKKSGNCYPVFSDSGYVVFENLKGERVYVNTLPYPNEARFKEGKSDESFEDKINRWIAFGERGKYENSEIGQNIPSIFLSHIFAMGGVACDSERSIDLGGARLVSLNSLPKCDYCALGHLHKRQRLGENIYYSGAIMRFSFDEVGAEKSVNVFNLTKDGVSGFKQIELKNIKNLKRFQALDAESGIKLLTEADGDYVELTLNLSQPLNHTQTVELYKCENLLSLKTIVICDNNNLPAVTHKGKSGQELFCDYYKSKYDCNPPAELTELFLSLTEDV
jgi:exonuclease SbcD